MLSVGRSVLLLRIGTRCWKLEAGRALCGWDGRDWSRSGERRRPGGGDGRRLILLVGGAGWWRAVLERLRPRDGDRRGDLLLRGTSSVCRRWSFRRREDDALYQVRCSWYLCRWPVGRCVDESAGRFGPFCQSRSHDPRLTMILRVLPFLSTACHCLARYRVQQSVCDAAQSLSLPVLHHHVREQLSACSLKIGRAHV